MIQDLLHVYLSAVEIHWQPLLRSRGRTYWGTDPETFPAELRKLELALIEPKLLLEFKYLLEVISFHVL